MTNMGNLVVSLSVSGPGDFQEENESVLPGKSRLRFDHG